MTMQYDNLEDKLSQLVEYTKDSGKIDLSLYTEYDVKRGLRDSTGKGVLTGLTEISDVIGFDIDERTGEKVPTDGRLSVSYTHLRAHETDQRYGRTTLRF